ncbi:hypothetical protein ABB37_04737 [Leptomonas pyrrhocoris]|uniref:Uncharacterized protein n=1 Tax=Leptomonas pyrrhocoris TaxID=157538 RepID=A0A0M9G1X5_LEPPY|nr:hypothetical protein ABB37_04737 [Leptomonas pyrrhocoris]KPA80527.1 hypothetical protein ABB37_04737 [Leptomonas pyrrhocoris]|eukprot:XP_015658966.1 hypothetical protein ABB37_04737 [Leptomonas pyrrhocoris]
MTGRRGVGRPPAKKTAAAATAVKSTTKLSVPHADSLPSLTRSGQRRGHLNTGAAEGTRETRAEVEEEEVTLVYRKPSTRSTRPQREAAGALRDDAVRDAASHGAVASFAPSYSSSTSSPETSTLAFMQRATGQVNLARYLAHCGVEDVQLRSESGEAVYAVTQDQVFHCSNDRLETAFQALRNIESLLLTPADTSSASGTPWVGHVCWVRPAHQQAMVALARVCEAAVPLQLPSLVDASVLAIMDGKERSRMTWRLSLALAEGRRTHRSSRISNDASDSAGSVVAEKSGAAGTVAALFAASSQQPTSTSAAATNVELVPSPVRLSDVHRRLRLLRRLRQLRNAYGTLLPRLHSAGTNTELCRCLFSHDADTCQTLRRLRELWMSAGASTALPELSDPFPMSIPRTRGGAAAGISSRAKALYDVLSSFLGNPLLLDTLLPFVGISARHPHEEALLQHLVAQLKEDTAVDAATWGPMAAMASWRCTDGFYVVQHAARVRALRRVLAAAQFYGLPRFLRSIRATASMAAAGTAAATSVLSGGESSNWMKPTTLLRAQAREADQFFLTPDLLDPASFTQPDSMQVQLVQEELITLQRAHGAFCLVVGEADEIVTLVHDHLAFAGRRWQHVVKKHEEEGGVVKTERPAEDDDEEGDGIHARANAPSSSFTARETQARSSPRDPLYGYVLRTVDAAHRHALEKAQPPHQSASSATAVTHAVPLPFSHVQWVEGGSTNQWSPSTHYYGLVYMVVLETDEQETEEGSLVTEGLLPETAISITEGDGAATLRPPRSPTYCLNAMLELWRS